MDIKAFFKRQYNNFHINIAPKVVDLFAYPQTIKPADVEVVKDEKTGFYVSYDELGMPTFYYPYQLKKKMIFSDKQVIDAGQVAYFKIEPIEFILGAQCSESYQNRKGQTSYRKIDSYGLMTKKILCSKAAYSSGYFFYDREELSKAEFDEQLKLLGFNWNAMYDRLDAFTQFKSGLGTSIKVKKRVTDFALATGVYSKGKCGYYGYALDRAIAPNGKITVTPRDLTDEDAGCVFMVYADKRSIKEEIKETKLGRAEDRKHLKELKDYRKAQKELAESKAEESASASQPAGPGEIEGKSSEEGK